MRPEPGASATAKAAEALGLKPIVVPLFEVGPIAWDAPDPGEFDAILLTSANALRHGGGQLDRLASLPAYCVGEATAAAALEAGFTVAGAGEGGVDELLAAIPAGTRLLHLCGADRREPAGAGHSIRSIPVYRSAEVDPGDALAGIKGAVVAVHSPRAASAFARRAEQSGLRRETIAIAAISKAASEAVGDGWEAVEVAERPTDAALLSLASRLCEKRG